MRVNLRRFAYTPDSTEGIMLLPDGHYVWTLERPWRGNRRSESCIPEGTYQLEPWTRPNGDLVYIVHGGTVVKTDASRTSSSQRSLILIHAANFVHQIEGCIAPGLQREPGKVWNSRGAMLKLRGTLGVHFSTRQQIWLEISHQPSPCPPTWTPGQLAEYNEVYET